MALNKVNLIDFNDHDSCNEGQEELPPDEPVRLLTELMTKQSDIISTIDQRLSNLEDMTRRNQDTDLTPPPQNFQASTPYTPKPNLTHPVVNPHFSMPTGTSTCVMPRTFALRPKDIPIVTLRDLHGLETESRIARFFDQVESCAQEDPDRIQVAMNRVDTPIATLLQREIKKLTVCNWEDVKKIMSQNFCSSHSLPQVWRELEGEKYHIDEEPRAFVNRITCKYSAIEQKFPNAHIPSRDKLIKKRLYKGLPPRSQSLLSDFLDGETPLQEFIEMIENERDKTFMGNMAGNIPVFTVKPDKPESQVTPSLTSQIETLQAHVKQLTDRINKGQGPKIYCAFCRCTEHNLAKCPRNPPRGVCFDCLQKGFKRGHEDCPKKPIQPQVGQTE